ncbi:hypothetical protein [Streptomyces sp. NPDC057702]|uniref:hypothetical protein n=1 Tax=unclassified Streptomyces TaxID=2593676 RepID=UPI0036A3C75E
MALQRHIGRLGPAAVTLAALAGLFGTIALTATDAPPAGSGHPTPADRRTSDVRDGRTEGVPDGADSGSRPRVERGAPHRAVPSGAPLGPGPTRARNAP